jgi:hypothetical protein
MYQLVPAIMREAYFSSPVTAAPIRCWATSLRFRLRTMEQRFVGGAIGAAVGDVTILSVLKGHGPGLLGVALGPRVSRVFFFQILRAALERVGRKRYRSFPPQVCAPGAMERPMMAAAERHGELVAHLATERPLLGKADGCGSIRRLPHTRHGWAATNAR